jgi:hypothetical protein
MNSNAALHPLNALRGSAAPDILKPSVRIKSRVGHTQESAKQKEAPGFNQGLKSHLWVNALSVAFG